MSQDPTVYQFTSVMPDLIRHPVAHPLESSFDFGPGMKKCDILSEFRICIDE